MISNGPMNSLAYFSPFNISPLYSLHPKLTPLKSNPLKCFIQILIHRRHQDKILHSTLWLDSASTIREDTLSPVIIEVFFRYCHLYSKIEKNLVNCNYHTENILRLAYPFWKQKEIREDEEKEREGKKSQERKEWDPIR